MTIENPAEGAGAEAIESAADAAPETEATAEKAENAEPPKSYSEDDFKKLQNELARERRRIGKITAQKYQYKAELDQYSKRLADLEKNAPKAEGPKASDFQTYDDYLKAVTRHEINQSKAEAQQNTAPLADYQKQVWRAQRAPVMEANVNATKQMFPDFQQKLQENAAVLNSLSQDVADVFLDADNGAAAIYQLIEDGMLPLLNGMNVDTVQALVERAEEKALSAKKTPVSKAPAPMASARGTAPGAKTVDSMSGKEILKWVNS